MKTEKQIVSPFEFAIAQIADPEKAKEMRPETDIEKQKRVHAKFDDFVSKIKTTGKMNGKKALVIY